MPEGKTQEGTRPGAAPFEEESTVVLRKRARSRPVPMTHGIIAVLTVLEGRHHGEVFSLQGGNNLMGRAQEANILLVDHGVSRRHAQVRVDVSGVVELLDLGSTNGTFVNGERITKESLRVGDRIRVGIGAVLELGQVTSCDGQKLVLDEPHGPPPLRSKQPTDPMGTCQGRPELPMPGDSDEIVSYARLLEIRRRRLGENDEAVAELFERLGVALQASGQVERASKCLTRALVILQAREPRAPRPTARVLGRLAECDCALDRPQAAVARLERAERLLRATIATPEEIAGVRLMLSQVLWRLGRDPEVSVALARLARDVLVSGGCMSHPMYHGVQAWLRCIGRGRTDEPRSLTLGKPPGGAASSLTVRGRSNAVLAKRR